MTDKAIEQDKEPTPLREELWQSLRAECERDCDWTNPQRLSSMPIIFISPIAKWAAQEIEKRIAGRTASSNEEYEKKIIGLEEHNKWLKGDIEALKSEINRLHEIPAAASSNGWISVEERDKPAGGEEVWYYYGGRKDYPEDAKMFKVNFYGTFPLNVTHWQRQYVPQPPTVNESTPASSSTISRGAHLSTEEGQGEEAVRSKMELTEYPKCDPAQCTYPECECNVPPMDVEMVESQLSEGQGEEQGSSLIESIHEVLNEQRERIAELESEIERWKEVHHNLVESNDYRVREAIMLHPESEPDAYRKRWELLYSGITALVSEGTAKGGEAAGRWKIVPYSYQIADTGDYDGHYELTDGKIKLVIRDDSEDGFEKLVNVLNEYDCRIEGDGSLEAEVQILKYEKDELKQRLEQLSSQEAKAIAEKVEKAYWQWCKESKRNGSVLVGGSIKEFFQYLSQFKSPSSPVKENI